MACRRAVTKQTLSFSQVPGIGPTEQLWRRWLSEMRQWPGSTSCDKADPKLFAGSGIGPTNSCDADGCETLNDTSQTGGRFSSESFHRQLAGSNHACAPRRLDPARMPHAVLKLPDVPGPGGKGFELPQRWPGRDKVPQNLQAGAVDVQGAGQLKHKQPWTVGGFWPRPGHDESSFCTHVTGCFQPPWPRPGEV